MKIIAKNKRAGFDFELLEKYEAGLVLRGFEVKAIKNGRVNLIGAHIIIRDNEPLLVGADVPPYQPKNTPPGYDSQRTRKLLLRRAEIKKFAGRVQEKGLTLVPVSIYTKQGKIKLEFALARGKRRQDKRQKIAQRESERRIQRAFRGKF